MSIDLDQLQYDFATSCGPEPNELQSRVISAIGWAAVINARAAGLEAANVRIKDLEDEIARLRCDLQSRDAVIEKLRKSVRDLFLTCFD